MKADGTDIVNITRSPSPDGSNNSERVLVGHAPADSLIEVAETLFDDAAMAVDLFWWALRGSNPRPSPCKGGTNTQVRALCGSDRVPVSTPQYLGVPLRCYAKCYARSGC